MISPVPTVFFYPFKLAGRLAIQRISTTGPVHPAFLFAVKFSIQKSGDISNHCFPFPPGYYPNQVRGLEGSIYQPDTAFILYGSLTKKYAIKCLIFIKGYFLAMTMGESRGNIFAFARHSRGLFAESLF